MLRYLLERPGRLVAKEELLDGVWPGLAVGEAVLTGCLRELRRALGDDARRPQYIETVHRRGYRFMAPVSEAEADAGRAEAGRAADGQAGGGSAVGMVGREAELGRLHTCLAQVRNGQRRVVFVTGEAGIGKTTLLDVFLAQATADELWLAQGECLEHYGTGEAYLPVLAALGRLCRGPGGAQFVDLLRQQAPTWLVQMPALLHQAELEAVQEWSAAAVAAGLAEEAEAVEGRCARLARAGQFLAANGVEAWPDGTVAGRYRFRHALYHQMVYERIPAGQCLRLHRQLGARLEAGYRERAWECAAELALHFERGRDDGRAVRYLQQAAVTAGQRWAYQEAVRYLTHGLELFQRLPDTPARTQPGWLSSPRRWRCTPQESTRESCIGSRGSCCCRQGTTRRHGAGRQTADRRQ